MKFITSTHLKQWADTKECQQLLPELIKKLIDASVTNIDRLSFPSGDAVYLPGWDGVVSCDECIDIVPAGISLWECGATENVKGKIDGDCDKRTKNSLGYVKSDSTFVFVTPRIWEGADEWLNNHQNEWKKVVVYTAVELENWIEKNPSVGMWLAEKLRILPSKGYELPETYWNKWAQGKDYALPYGILLPGRDEASKQIVNACKNTDSLIIQALTQNESIAFSIASIMTCDDAEVLKDRLIVVTDKDAYNDLVEHYNNLIIVTTITEGINYSTKRGHTVVVASTPADQINSSIKLPRIDREGFINALEQIGVDKAKARKIASDTARDVNVLRRREKIVIDKPKWAEPNKLQDLIPAILGGKWYNSVDGDKKIIELLSGMDYAQYEAKLLIYLAEEDSPLIHIGNMWRVRSPYEAMSYISVMLSDSILTKYKDVCLNLIQDDDPEAIDILEQDELKLRKFNQKYSSTIKNGVFQNLILISLVENIDDEKLSRWVEQTMLLLFKDWDLQRFLSNRHYITALAEASPKSFLCFMEKLPKETASQIFQPRKRSFSLSGWDVYYTEALWSLEMLAWDVEYLNRVTTLLFDYAEYENDSNYANKPINTLSNIYRLLLPQTFATFDERMIILKSKAAKSKSSVYKLCLKLLQALNGGLCEYNHYFSWRMFGKLEYPKYYNHITNNELKEVVSLMLQCCNYSAEDMAEIITLSSNSYMSSCRTLMIESVKSHINNGNDNQIVIDALRKDIVRQTSCPGAKWALPENDLKLYQDLLYDIAPKDIMHKNAWLFEFYYVQLPNKKIVRSKIERQKLQEARNEAIREIVTEHGIDSIWEFIKIVKCPESMSESLVSMYGDTLLKDVCDRYKSEEITENFTRSYLSCLCYTDIENYKKLVKPIVESDNDLVIVLYAPRYNKGLAEIASNLGDGIKSKYWKSVDVSFIEIENATEVLHEIIIYDRYSDAINVIYHNKDRIQLTDLEIIKVIYGYVTNNTCPPMQFDTYYIKNLLEDLDKSEDSEVIKLLIFVEFLLYRVLEHETNMKNSRFIKELTHDPELMIQLVELAYKPDDGMIEQLDGIEGKNREVLAECAIHVLCYGSRTPFCLNDEGKLDESLLEQYIDKLDSLAKQKKRTKVIDYIVGNILGDITRDDNYPPKVLCDIVERRSSDTVDNHIRIRIYNSRGVVVRSPFEGGVKERQIISELEGYRDKTKLLYPRMTKIFDDLIADYKREATHEDNVAIIEDLEN